MSTTPRRTRLDPEQRRSQILDAASELFAVRGYGDVSIEDIARRAGVTRGLVHHYFGGRNDVYVALIQRIGSIRERELRQPVGSSARERVGDSVSRWLDWTQENRTIWLAAMAPGEHLSDQEVRRVVADLVERAVRLLILLHSDVAEDSPRLRYALECWTGMNRAATWRWLHGKASRETTHELLTLTLLHVLRTFGTAAADGTGTAEASPTGDA
jgi:AcrR family transcriptional regulator